MVAKYRWLSSAEKEWRPVKWLGKLLRKRHPLVSGKRNLTQADFEREVLPLVAGKMGGSYGIWFIEKNWWWRDFASTD